MTDKPRANDQTIKEQAGYWIVRQNSGRWSGRDEQAFRQWLLEKPEHAQAFAQVKNLWQGLDRFKSVTPLPAINSGRANRPAPSHRWMLGGLGTLSLILGLYMLNPDPSYLIPSGQSYSTLKGQQTSVALADGSEIVLNTDSEVTIAYNLWQRRIKLKRGEAAFKVAHETLRGFTVEAGRGEIIDIGTQFNVQQLPGQVQVTVTEGAVRVKTARQSSPPLLAGQRLAFSDDGILSVMDRADLGTVSAWRQGHIIFDMTPLDEAAAQVARYHAVKFVFDEAKLKRLKISGTFNSQDLKGFLVTLESLYPLRTQWGSGQIVHLTSAARR